MTIKSITRGIPANRSFFARYGTLVVIPLLILAPFVGWGAMKAAMTNNNNIRQWLPHGLPAAETYDRFRRHFGTDEFAVVSWDGCSLDDPRLDQFAQMATSVTTRQIGTSTRSFMERITDRLDEALIGVVHHKLDADARIFADAVTGPQAIRQLMAAPFDRKLTRVEAIDRVRGVLVGNDGVTSCCVLRLTQAGNEDRVAAVEAIQLLAARLGLPSEALHIGGDVVFNAAIDIESRNAINRLAAWSVLAAIVASIVSLRSVRLAIIVLICAAYCAALSSAFVYFTGGTMNLVMIVMPVLVLVLGVSGCIHIVHYYREQVARDRLRGASGRSVRAAWVPCVLAAVTTAIGLASLLVSHVGPVRQFGVYGAAGTMLTLFFNFMLLPTLLERYPAGPHTSDASPDDDASTGFQAHPWIDRAIDLIIRRRATVIACFLVVMALAGIGLLWTQTSVKTSRFFRPDHRLLTDTSWLEERIGPLVPFEVLLRFDQTNKQSMLQRLELVSGVHRKLASTPSVGGIVAATTYAPAMTPPGSPTTPGLPRSLLNMGLEANRAYFVDRRVLSSTPDETDALPTERWRITARFTASNELHYDELLQRVQSDVNDYLAALPAEQRIGVSAVYTGTVPLLHAAQKELLNGLFSSFVMAFFLIGGAMAILLRGLRAGIISMLPNICPGIVIFGVMGWCGFPIDVGAILTASVAMGIAVDGTLHLLTWFRRAVAEGKDHQAALRQAYQRCGAALFQTGAITALSMVVFVLASFQPVAQFGLLMCLMIVAATLADLVLTPAIIATNWGRLFMKRMPDGAVHVPLDAALPPADRASGSEQATP